MISLLRWPLRFWLLLSFCWVVGVGDALQEELCAAMLWRTPKEISDHNALLIRQLASPGQSAEARNLLIADFEKYLEPRPGRACLAADLSSKTAKQTGGYSVDWKTRLPALAILLLPPLNLLLIGLMLMWAAGAFRRRS